MQSQYLRLYRGAQDMRPSAARLIRLVPRSSVQLTQKVVPSAAERPPEVKPPTLLDILLERREKAGDRWPSNIRIETPISKAALKDVQSGVRTQLKKLLKER